MKEVNFINLILIVVFFTPILVNLFTPLTGRKIQKIIYLSFNNLRYLVGFLLALVVTKIIVFHSNDGFLKIIRDSFPNEIKNLIYSKDITSLLLIAPLVFIVYIIFTRTIFAVFYKKFLYPLSSKLYHYVEKQTDFSKKLLNVLIVIPKSLLYLYFVVISLYFSSLYITKAEIADIINESGVYKITVDYAVKPTLNSKLVKYLPVLVKDYKSLTIALPDNASGHIIPGSPRIIKYFNGVRLTDAIVSDTQIDETARLITSSYYSKEKSSKDKAYEIYKWICTNCKYDYKKADDICKDIPGISSGAKYAFYNKSGVCFDFSCLYIAMCRAVDLKVRLVTGLGYSGSSWGDHAWNQVYCEEEGRWIDLDTTFGISGDYFDNPDFKEDHMNEEIQGEW